MANTLDILTNQTRSTLDSAASLAISSKHAEISNIHFLWAIISDSSSILNQVFNKYDINKEASINNRYEFHHITGGMRGKGS